jgi:organic hydroperoxide reductase OsmC/OhrA
MEDATGSPHRENRKWKDRLIPYSGETLSYYNPEELLVAALSACHMLWFLHLCSEAGVVVTDYTDQPEGWMLEESDGSGRFTGVVLKPSVRLANQELKDRLNGLHAQAHAMCFIARSVNFPVHVLPAEGSPHKR